MAKRERIGILGGTFDPVHRGHIRLALSALDACALDRLLVVPAGNPPHKTCLADAEDRWKMVVSACACDKRLVPSRLEIDRPGISCTADTLSALRSEYPKADLFFVVGEDALAHLHHWPRLGEILRLCTFAVCPRPDAPDSRFFSSETSLLSAMGGRFVTVPSDPLPASSSEIRLSLSAGKDPEVLDVSVYEYCRCKGLYGMDGKLEHIGPWMDRLFSALNAGRFAHSLSVAYTAVRLAGLHGADPLRAEQAGLLHDCAKCLPAPEMRGIAEKNALTDDESILSSGALLHSQVGAWVAEHEYGMRDPEVLEAIACHNTGLPGMSRLSMCVCLADSIEPLRKSYPLLDEVRALAEQSLERALLRSLEGTADYVLSRGKFLHPRTQDTIRWLKTLV